MRFSHAIVCLPAYNFAEGLTTVDLGVPDYARALAAHEQYCQALGECGVFVTYLEADPRYPDSTFVEDTAILTRNMAIFTHPGAESRQGEGPVPPLLGWSFLVLAAETIEPAAHLCELLFERRRRARG